MYQTIIGVETLAENYQNSDWIVIDCRFELSDVDAGRKMYEEAHIPGAVYAHVDDDMSGPPFTDAGRHPLPTPDKMRELFGRIGITPTAQVIIYDHVGGVYAGRLWWMLKYMGHANVAVLEGGWPLWVAANHPTSSGTETNEPTTFVGEPNADMLVQLADVEAQPLLVDSRAAGRYAGEFEPLDKRAGHIPGARNHHFPKNWDGDSKLFLSPEQLRANFEALFGDVPSDQVTFYCGSGVSANVNLIAVAHAGLPLPKLYVGSWSEWSSDDDRSAATSLKAE